MDSSSSNSSSSHYTGSAFPANAAAKPRWELPIYESTPHFPPMDNSTFIALNSQHNNSNNNRFAPSFYSNHNCGGGAGSTAAREDEFGGDRDRAPPPEREHMFDKVVTPSDVGKLNRLVIPKQHAEKHFPLDSNSSEKGLLLDFEDRNGKSWRFRYSYWNSSQSYVMTKGWSRFVKEKKLDAGDVVSFQRGVGEIGKDRFYIDWRRRPEAPPPHPPPHLHHHTIQFQHAAFPLHRPYLSGPRPPPPLPPPPLVLHHHQRGSVISYNNLASGYNYGSASPNFNHHGSVAYMRGGGGGGPPQMQMELAGSSNYNASGPADESAVVFDSVPVVHGGGKRLRLFGVNMDCTVTESASLAVNVPDSSIPVAETGSSLHGSDFTTDSTTTTTTIEFLDKGKSSMSLDFDI